MKRAKLILKSDKDKGKQILGNVDSLGVPSKDKEKGKSGKLDLEIDDEFGMEFLKDEDEMEE